MARHDRATALKFDRDEGMAPKPEPRRMAQQLEELCFDALTKIPTAKVMDVVMQWAAKADIDPGDAESATRVMEATALAGLLTLFSPTLLGPSPLERYIRQRRADASAEENAALEALAKIEFHLLRFESLAAPQTFVLKDLASGERLLLHDEDIPQSSHAGRRRSLARAALRRRIHRRGSADAARSGDASGRSLLRAAGQGTEQRAPLRRRDLSSRRAPWRAADRGIKDLIGRCG